MDQELRHSGRETSERLQRRLIYQMVNRVNTFLKYKKTSEEKERTKKVISEHKKALKAHYGGNYNRKIMNLPDFAYQITHEM